MTWNFKKFIWFSSSNFYWRFI